MSASHRACGQTIRRLRLDLLVALSRCLLLRFFFVALSRCLLLRFFFVAGRVADNIVGIADITRL
jgi:hypothetical protein